jgi:probable rRNA maturation factor
VISLLHKLSTWHSKLSTHMSSDRVLEPSSPELFAITLTNQQCEHAIDDEQLIEAARRVLHDSKFTSAAISLAIVDDPTIHDLNRRYLNHDYPTDVLSFPLEERDTHLEGEVILSADTAAAEAVEIGWPPAAEQLLYVIHGMLHLVGYRDKSPEEAQVMRAAEAKHLRSFGIDIPHPSRSSEAGEGSIRTAGWEGGRTDS